MNTLLIVVFLAFLGFVLLKRALRPKSITNSALEELRVSLPGFSKIDVAQIATLSSNDIYEITDTVEAIVFPRFPFELNQNAKIRMRQSLVESLTLNTKLTPAQALSISVLDDDQLATALGAFKALYEFAKQKGK
jgi:hypothetical protein